MARAAERSEVRASMVDWLEWCELDEDGDEAQLGVGARALSAEATAAVFSGWTGLVLLVDLSTALPPTQDVPQASAPPPRHLGPRASHSLIPPLPSLLLLLLLLPLLLSLPLASPRVHRPRAACTDSHPAPAPAHAPHLHPYRCAPPGWPGAHRDHARRQHLEAHPGRPNQGAHLCLPCHSLLALAALLCARASRSLTSFALLPPSPPLALLAVRRRLLGALVRLCSPSWLCKTDDELARRSPSSPVTVSARRSRSRSRRSSRCALSLSSRSRARARPLTYRATARQRPRRVREVQRLGRHDRGCGSLQALDGLAPEEQGRPQGCVRLSLAQADSREKVRTSRLTRPRARRHPLHPGRALGAHVVERRHAPAARHLRLGRPVQVGPRVPDPPPRRRLCHHPREHRGRVLGARAPVVARRRRVAQDHDAPQDGAHRALCVRLCHQERPQARDGRPQGQHHEARRRPLPQHVPPRRRGVQGLGHHLLRHDVRLLSLSPLVSSSAQPSPRPRR